MNEQQLAADRHPRTTIMDRDGRVYPDRTTTSTRRMRFATWWFKLMQRVRSWWESG